MIMKFKMFETIQKSEIKRGDIVNADGRVGLVVSDEFLDEDHYKVFDVCFRSQSCDILEIYTDDIDLEPYPKWEDISSYVSIAKREGYIINIPENYKDDFPELYKKTQMRLKSNIFNI